MATMVRLTTRLNCALNRPYNAVSQLKIGHLVYTKNSPIIQAHLISTTTRVCSVNFDRNSGSFVKGPKTTETRPAIPDPRGRRKKDRVPDTFELIASSDHSIQRFFSSANYVAQFIWLAVAFRFTTVVIPAILARGRYVSIFDVIMHNDHLFAISFCLPAISFGIFMYRYILNCFVLRLYMDRETEEYAAVYQGFLRATPHFFTHKDVRMNPKSSSGWWRPHAFFKGKGAVLDANEFKNVRDYNQLLRYAKKLQYKS